MSAKFPKSMRLKSPGQFTVILRRGVCVADDALVMFALASPPGTSRLGITIPKKTGNAVVRNRWKRLIRESYRTQLASIPAGIDIVIRPKKDADASWETIVRSVPALAKRAAGKLNVSKPPGAQGGPSRPG